MTAERLARYERHCCNLLLSYLGGRVRLYYDDIVPVPEGLRPNLDWQPTTRRGLTAAQVKAIGATSRDRPLAQAAGHDRSCERRCSIARVAWTANGSGRDAPSAAEAVADLDFDELRTSVRLFGQERRGVRSPAGHVKGA